MLETDYVRGATKLPDHDAPETDLTRRQLEAIRDEWLGPLLMQLRHQSEEVGRLQVQCQQFQEERDAVIAERDDLREQLETRPEGDPPPPPTVVELAGDLLDQLRTTEGAVVVGIAIAIGLWFGVGVFAWVLLG
ncbi:hypothetical protein BH23CHL2_BH23CHL2_17940 [soil metagenome]